MNKDFEIAKNILKTHGLKTREYFKYINSLNLTREFKKNKDLNRHHIVPKSIEKCDIMITITLDEHIELHRILYEANKNNKQYKKSLASAFNYIKARKFRKPESEENRKMQSERMKGKGNPNYGKCLSDETKRKLSEANKGKQSWLGKHHTEETKQKLSEKLKNNTNTLGKHWHLSEQTKHNISVATKGKKKSEHMKKALSESRKGTCMYTNGEINIYAKECPEGFWKGCTKKK